MKKTLIIISVLITILCVGNNSFALSGSEAIAAFKSKMRNIDKMSGIITIAYPDGMMYTGAFIYQSGGRFYIKFSSPAGKTIVSNGKKLWVYDPGKNVCGIQDLNKDKGSSGGIASLIYDYFGIATPQGSNILIKLKKPDRHYNEILILTDSSYMLKKAVLKTKEGASLTFTLSNIKLDANISVGQFNFNVPSDAQVVQNPLNIR